MRLGDSCHGPGRPLAVTAIQQQTPDGWPPPCSASRAPKPAAATTCAACAAEAPLGGCPTENVRAHRPRARLRDLLPHTAPNGSAPTPGRRQGTRTATRPSKPPVRTHDLHICLSAVAWASAREFPPGWRGGLSPDVPAVPVVVSRRGDLSGVPGPVALAWGVLLSKLRVRAGVADRPGAVDVRRVRGEDLGDGGHHFPPVAHPVVDVVRGDLVRHLAEERGLRAGSTGCLGVRLLRDGVGVAAQAAPGHGAPEVCLS